MTNTGNTSLTQVAVTDDHAGVTVQLPGRPHSLAPGDFMTCTADGIATVSGLYTNLGTVERATTRSGRRSRPPIPPTTRARRPGSTSRRPPTASTPTSHPARSSRSASPVNWTYTVRNTGTAPISDVNLDRRPGRDAGPPERRRRRQPARDAGETWPTRASDLHGRRRPVREQRLGDPARRGSPVLSTTRTPSHYFGSAPAIHAREVRERRRRRHRTRSGRSSGRRHG